MSLSLKSLKSKSMKLMKNDLLTNLVILITLALVVSYLSKGQYEALLIMVLISGVIYLLGKNLLYALVIGIILTNLLISSRVLRVREGMTEEKDKKNKKAARAAEKKAAEKKAAAAAAASSGGATETKPTKTSEDKTRIFTQACKTAFPNKFKEQIY